MLCIKLVLVFRIWQGRVYQTCFFAHTIFFLIFKFCLYICLCFMILSACMKNCLCLWSAAFFLRTKKVSSDTDKLWEGLDTGHVRQNVQTLEISRHVRTCPPSGHVHQTFKSQMLFFLFPSLACAILIAAVSSDTTRRYGNTVTVVLKNT